MVMLSQSQFSTFRPSLLKVWLCSPLFLTAVGASAQVLAGQTYTIVTAPDTPSDHYSASLRGPNGSVPLTKIPGPTSYVSYVSPPLTAGQYYAMVTDLNYASSYSTVSSLFVFPADGSAQSSLSGQYVFQLAGKTNASGQTVPSVVAAGGSFTADGKGNITAGVVDINSPAGIVAGESVTGTYQVNAFGVGTLNLVTSQFTLQLTLASAPLTASVSSGTNPALQVSAPLVSGGVVATTAGGLAAASGTFVQLAVPTLTSASQYPSHAAPPATLSNGYLVSLSGQSFGAALSGAANFQFTASGTLTADVTVAENGSLVNFPGWTGTYTPFDPVTGRSVVTLTDPAQPEAPAQVFSAYESPQGVTLYLTSIAPGQVTGLLTGRANQ